MTAVELTQADLARVEAINKEIPGYSGPHHYAFFKGVLEQFQHIKSILVLGVYHGRDMCYILDAANRMVPEVFIEIAGVDKFSDDACDDWPTDKRSMTWQQAGFGQAPNCSRAADNLMKFGPRFESRLVQSGDAEFLERTHWKFDFIYLDTAHDYQTVARQLQQVKRVCRGPETIIAGDDYSDAGTWGVRSAVTNGFTSHEVFAEWIWISNAARLKP